MADARSLRRAPSARPALPRRTHRRDARKDSGGGRRSASPRSASTGPPRSRSRAAPASPGAPCSITSATRTASWSRCSRTRSGASPRGSKTLPDRAAVARAPRRALRRARLRSTSRVASTSRPSRSCSTTCAARIRRRRTGRAGRSRCRAPGIAYGGASSATPRCRASAKCSDPALHRRGADGSGVDAACSKGGERSLAREELALLEATLVRELAQAG